MSNRDKEEGERTAVAAVGCEQYLVAGSWFAVAPRRHLQMNQPIDEAAVQCDSLHQQLRSYSDSSASGEFAVRLSTLLYKRCSDVIVVTRRHVGGIYNINQNWVKCGSLKHSSARVILRPYVSTGVQFHRQKFAHISSLQSYTPLQLVYLQHGGLLAAYTIVDRMT